jgi:hypothetical protein
MTIENKRSPERAIQWGCVSPHQRANLHHRIGRVGKQFKFCEKGFLRHTLAAPSGLAMNGKS